MSQSSLKKELSKLDAPQIIEIILDAYKARAEIKDYFEFYLNPDVKKISDKAKRNISKEYSRVKWNRSKARVTVINKAIKNFESYMPGTDAVIDLLLYDLTVAGETEKRLLMTESVFNHVTRIIEKALNLANDAGTVETIIQKLNDFVADDNRLASKYFKRLVTVAVENYISQSTP